MISITRYYFTYVKNIKCAKNPWIKKLISREKILYIYAPNSLYNTSPQSLIALTSFATMPPIFPKPFKVSTPEEKISKCALLDMLCVPVWEEKLKENGNIKRGFVSDLIKRNTSLIPSLTCNSLNNALRKYAKAGITPSAQFAAHYRTKITNPVTFSLLPIFSP